MPTLAPTLAQQDLILAFQDQLSLYGHALTSTGTNSFQCLMTPASPAELVFDELLKDLREVSVVTALSVPNWVVAQMQLTDETGQQWTTLKRIDNPSGIAVEIWVQKVTDKD